MDMKNYRKRWQRSEKKHFVQNRFMNGYVYRSFCGRSNERTEKNRIHLNRADKKVERYKEIGNEKANDIVDLYTVIGIGRM